MLAPQPTASEPSRQDPFRWHRTDIAAALDNFSDPDSLSQREYAQQHGIPQATFNYWVRHYAAAQDDPVAAFFRSEAGELVLRRILLAALSTFQLQGACGIRPVGTFLQRAGLDRFVACSRGALHPLAQQIEADLVAFRDSEQAALVQQMQPRTITLVADEHFHSSKPCLVALEPTSGFVLVECYRDRRDANTWQEAIGQSTAGMPLQIIQLTSDLARGLLCCAEKGLQAVHSPDLFHGQRDLLQPFLLPLTRPLQQAEKQLEKVTQQRDKLDGPLEEPQSQEDFLALMEACLQEQALRKQIEQARELQQEAVQQVRAVADDYHPFDRQTGQPLTAQEVGQRLTTHLDRLAEVAEQAGLGEKAQAALNKARTWLVTLMGCVAWFWCQANALLQELELSEEQERLVKEKLLAGHYWAQASGRARTAQERKRLKQLAEELTKQAWQEGGVLSSLAESDREAVQAVAQEAAGLFQRSSSSVEGRNGRLALQQHGHSRVSQQRLKALTVLHNYMVGGPDGTTAAERFFGQKHTDVFSWLLERMPDLPRPAPKRPKKDAEGLPLAG